jgi:folate/biopterin transporter
MLTDMRLNLTRILIPFVYFIQGAVSLAGVATTFFYKQDLHLTIPQVAILGSISIIPWSVKPLYGLLSDRWPIAGLKRKPYLIISGLLAAAGYIVRGLFVTNFAGAALTLLLSGAGIALSDVIVDGIVAEESRTQKVAGKLQSVCRAALLAGALLVAYLSGVLVEQIGTRNVFLLTGLLPLGTSLFALLLPEKREGADVSFSLGKTWKSMRKAVSPELLWAAAFLFIWRSTPSSGGAFHYYLIDELHFSPEFFGRLSLVSSVAGIAGVFVFRKFLLSIPLKKLFFWIMILSVVLSLPSLGLVYRWDLLLHVSPQYFAMADTLVTAPLSEIGFLPLLVLVARICPKGIEATMFALLASLMNIGLAVSDLLGGWLVAIFNVHQAEGGLAADYHHLHWVLWIAILSSLLPIPLLPFLPETRASEEWGNAQVQAGVTTGSAAPSPISRERQGSP